GAEKLGTRCEIKNLNSFRFLQHAIEFEARRQIELIEEGGTVEQETRLYDPDKRETRSMRTKEDAQDYRYFPDPDLPPLMIDEAWIARIRESSSESQCAMRSLLVAEHGLSDYDATQLTVDRDIADYYVKTIAAANASEPGSRQQIANWVLGELMAALNKAELGIARAPISPERLAGLLRRIADKTISGTLAKEIF